ncbi:hypothetical protein CEXT_706771 [Caerostris extrusa]|uniref:Uncharacterized protein n=1 Tax=Caerostris extrusa TaxID=172846 RepID=A0AAV4PVE1_CAEEX|nr:hypothetical protein CEXT_706771 [Caerostris extrusa]
MWVNNKKKLSPSIDTREATIPGMIVNNFLKIPGLVSSKSLVPETPVPEHMNGCNETVPTRGTPVIGTCVHRPRRDSHLPTVLCKIAKNLRPRQTGSRPVSPSSQQGLSRNICSAFVAGDLCTTSCGLGELGRRGN